MTQFIPSIYLALFIYLKLSWALCIHSLISSWQQLFKRRRYHYSHCSEEENEAQGGDSHSLEVAESGFELPQPGPGIHAICMYALLLLDWGWGSDGGEVDWLERLTGPSDEGGGGNRGGRSQGRWGQNDSQLLSRACSVPPAVPDSLHVWTY